MLTISSAVARAQRFAPFLARAMARWPEIARVAEDDGIEAAIAHALAPVDAPLGTALRRRKERLALALALGDLAGLLSFERVVGTLSAFADEALHAAIVDACERLKPGAGGRGFAALALGKHGGEELNYSSDIDPILVFDPATLPRRTRDEPVEAAARIARQVVETLQRRDGDGYVFRIDLRLRPAAEITPLALPVEAAIGHYESSALPWERAAFVRARAAAGDLALGQGMLDAIERFIWRRSLDFGAIDELRGLRDAIREGYAQGQEFGPGYDLKRGRGGIREVEFFVQMHQLIHGGRRPALRQRATLDALAALTEEGLVPRAQATALGDAYRLLRTIEHRVQMVDDRQTHRLPEGEALDGVAGLHGLEDGKALLALLRPHVEAVAAISDGLGGENAPSPPHRLDAFGQPEEVAERIVKWRSGSFRALRSASAIAAFDRVAGPLLEGLARAPNPPAALLAFEHLLAGLPSAVNLFRLLGARPQLLETLVGILAHAPTLADALARRPALLDRLIDATAYAALPDVVTLREEMTRAGELEAKLDHVRLTVGEYRLALGVQLLEGRSDPLALGAAYARLAEAALGTVAVAVSEAFAERHGRVPDAEFVVVGLGRLGGGALTDASDLDLVYLFTGDHLSESDGAKPLGATLYFNRLAQRMSTGLSAPTAAGPLYPVDTRLRPSGASGPLAVTLESFARYQRESAWTWEHMALTRARPVFGSEAARAAVDAVVQEALRRPRDAATLAREVVAMREDMRRHKPPGGPFDVKLGEGGLVDLEFAVHYHQLASGQGLDPDLDTALAALASAGLVDGALRNAYRLLTRLLVTLRLVSPALGEPPEESRTLIARACQAEDWNELLVRRRAARQCVGRHWQAVKAAAGEG